MIKKAVSFVLMLLAAGVVAAQSQSQPQTQTPATAPAKVAPPVPHTSLKVGQPAPDFTLPSTIVGPDGRSVVRYKLSDFKGKKNVVLAFYVFAFTGG
jgi:hypothetical protein